MTDGTVTPEAAFNNAVKVLQEQINALAPAALEAKAEAVEEEEIADEDDEEVVDEKRIKKEKKAKKEKKK